MPVALAIIRAHRSYILDRSHHRSYIVVVTVVNVVMTTDYLVMAVQMSISSFEEMICEGRHRQVL